VYGPKSVSFINKTSNFAGIGSINIQGILE